MKHRFLYFLIVFLLILNLYAAARLPFSSYIYKTFSFVDHQYPSRSFCSFYSFDGKFLYVGDCIEGFVYGEGFDGSKGFFVYNKDEVGFNRMDTFFYVDKVGYKFPLCARDIFLIIGLIISPIFSFLFGSNAVFFIFLAPLVLDGTFQLMFYGYESTNVVRAITGFLAGLGLGAIIFRWDR